MISTLAGIALACMLVRPAARLVRRIRHERAVGKTAKAADERMLDTTRRKRVKP